MNICRSIWPFALVTLISFDTIAQKIEKKPDSIQIAFLLDISGSMDQLLLKTKSQIWRIANYAATGTKRGSKPVIEVAVITYGLPSNDGQSEVLNDFTADLDSVAIRLHELTMGGGIEYCWTTINSAFSELTWSKKDGDLKLLIIAGNESFTQEVYDSKKVIAKSHAMHITINTIYCSTYEKDSAALGWKLAAERAKGNYFSISLNDSLDLRENFLDKKLIDFNDKLNATYIPFGPGGDNSYDRMIIQDNNSRMSGAPFFRERIVYKASDAFNNPTWDLVDAGKRDSTIFNNLDILKGTELEFNSSDELKAFIDDKRNMIRKYVGDNKGDKDLDLAIRQIIDKEGKKKNFIFKSE